MGWEQVAASGETQATYGCMSECGGSYCTSEQGANVAFGAAIETSSKRLVNVVGIQEQWMPIFIRGTPRPVVISYLALCTLLHRAGP